MTAQNQGMLKRFGRAILRRLPKNKLGDRIHHLAYFLVAHRRLPRRNSGLFNDYLFFLKTSGQLEDVIRQFTSDKELVKLWIEARLGNSFFPRTLAVLKPSELSGRNIPKNCVAKPTHLSGVVVFVSSEINEGDIQELRETEFKNLYDVFRESNYKNLRPMVLFEEMVDAPSSIVDYKIFCLRGEPKIIQVDVGRHTDHRRSLYAIDWNRIDVTYSKAKGPNVDRPHCLDRMLELARKIAQDFESVRVDLYISGDQIFVGELTHCPEQAHGRFGSRAEESLFSSIYFGKS
jgi:hypothetical protein